MLLRLVIFLVTTCAVLANEDDGVVEMKDGSKPGVNTLAFKSQGDFGGGAACCAGGEAYASAGGGFAAGGSISAAYKSHVAAPVAGSYSKHIHVVKEPKVDVVQVAVPVPVPQPEVKPVTTVIEKTVIPNYEKKIIKVPSYEEKVVRVPTVIEKEVWVPAAPTIIEKEVQVPQPAPPAVVHTVETYPVVYKRKHPVHIRKHFSFGGGLGGGGYSGGYGTGYGGGYDSSYTASVQKTVSPQLYEDIFNIPIQTLGAVSKLVGGIASGTSASGSVGISKIKSFGASKSFAASGSASAYH